MCGGHNLLRNILHQIFLGSQRCGAGLRNQPDAVAHAEHMCIYRHGRFIEYYTLDDVGCLASHSRQFDQFFQCSRYFAMKIFHQHLRHAHQVFCLVVGITYTPYVFINHFRRRSGQCLRSREIPVKRRGDHIYPFVRALCTQDNSYQ